MIYHCTKCHHELQVPDWDEEGLPAEDKICKWCLEDTGDSIQGMPVKTWTKGAKLD
jgi:hypothetical protein